MGLGPPVFRAVFGGLFVGLVPLTAPPKNRPSSGRLVLGARFSGTGMAGGLGLGPATGSPPAPFVSRFLALTSRNADQIIHGQPKHHALSSHPEDSPFFAKLLTQPQGLRAALWFQNWQKKNGGWRPSAVAGWCSVFRPRHGR
jgi:hypothetical protein